METFEKKLKRFILQENLIPQGCRVIVGVSGGADSTALLLGLEALRRQGMPFELCALHVEHGIRGAESIQDAGFTQELCARLGLPCKLVTVKVPAYAAAHGMGLEEAARILRYQALQQYAGECSGEVRIALAHHMEDNAETLLMAMVRGSGPRGLGGIRPIRRDEEGRIYIRPMLGLTRSEIEEYLQSRSQTWCSDSSNLDEEYTRNRVRRRILPELVRVNPQAIRHMNQTAALTAEMWEYVQQQAKERLQRIGQVKNGRLEIAIPELEALHPALRRAVILQALTDIGGRSRDLELLHVETVLSIAEGQSGKSSPLPYGMSCSREFDFLLLTGPLEEDLNPGESGFAALSVRPEMLEQLSEGADGDRELRLMLPDGCLAIRCLKFDGDFSKIQQKEYTKWFDYAIMKNGFRIREKQPGDYLVMDREGHRKKLTRCLIDDRIPVSQREQLLLLAQEDEVLWVIGGRRSYRARITAETETILEITYLKGDYHGLQQTL